MGIPQSTDVVLAGDIGGTKTNLGLYSRGNERPEPVQMQSYSSHDAACLEDLVARFQEQCHTKISSACFGIAGPVKGNHVRTTNLPWEVSARALRDRFGFERVSLMNDLVVTAKAVPLLFDDELATVNAGEAEDEAHLGLVAPGTGLGMALLVRHRSTYMAIPSEGGHVEFSPRNDRELALWQYLKKQLDHVSVERVVSGPGLYAIYQCLREQYPQSEPAWLAERLSEGDPPRIITDVALNQDVSLCVEALDIWVSVLGAVAGNLALTGLTRGGMYLGGGVVPRLMSKLKDNSFMTAFTDKGRFEDLMNRVPVKVILNDKAALLGAAWCAFQREE